MAARRAGARQSSVSSLRPLAHNSRSFAWPLCASAFIPLAVILSEETRRFSVRARSARRGSESKNPSAPGACPDSVGAPPFIPPPSPALDSAHGIPSCKSLCFSPAVFSSIFPLTKGFKRTNKDSFHSPLLEADSVSDRDTAQLRGLVKAKGALKWKPILNSVHCAVLNSHKPSSVRFEQSSGTRSKRKLQNSAKQSWRSCGTWKKSSRSDPNNREGIQRRK